jgi:hypothetical protein
MTIYTLTILLLLSLSLLEVTLPLSPGLKRALYLLAYLLLIFQVGLRWETGTDWDHYLAQFEAVTDFSSTAPSLSSPEYGYNISVWLIKSISSNYSVFLLLHAAIFFALVFNSIGRYTGILCLPLMLFYAETMGVMGSNRQLIAVAIGFFGLRYLYDGQIYRFLFFVALACMFHTSAIILLLFLIFRTPIRTRAVCLIVVAAIAIGLSPLPQLLFSRVGDLLGGDEFTKASYYLANSPMSLSDSGLSSLGLIKRICFLALFLQNRTSLSARLKYYNLMLNGYIVGVALYFACARSLLIVVSRGSLYFDILEPLLLASQLIVLRQKSSRVIVAGALCVAAFLFFFQSISLYPELFIPYKGIVINTRYSRLLY